MTFVCVLLFTSMALWLCSKAYAEENSHASLTKEDTTIHAFLLVTSVSADNIHNMKKEAQCKYKGIIGKVNRGQDYKIDIGKNIVFVLRKWHDPAIEGWRIEILFKNGRKPDDDVAWLLNPTLP